ncbi:type II toxin-antitoxin system HipA family toxin YjjJ [Geomonas anaerohicana]|uniref:Type II toxin-antitoxin system HipA family toxin YjjJ n=1 Tax=Geomonas anaerohicana TaxID=2798583 RepID=A0ABS0YKB4_9BACT|nr:type II toxin-antitoxin system HipA family toxin YjjJ [Geomonas anaerohicana]MBJ6752327.1 type II toxin-antitoxin system HipA family toxin YjjJ [Geomonas anaerohicana]
MSRTRSDYTDRLLLYLSSGVFSSEEIQKRLELSQPTVSRLIASLGSRVVAIGQARSRRYTTRRDLRGLGGEFPVYRIDAEGNARRFGVLDAIARDQYLWRPEGAPPEQYKSLPWFLSDLRPEGFVGRSFVMRLHEELALPPRGNDWQDDHVLIALARRGEDCMGDLVIGEESLERYFRSVREPQAPLRPDELPDAYPGMARLAMEGQPPGSSAGGEHPKFTAVVERDGAARHVLVKFSPPLDSLEGRRWADLLVCEHLALEVVSETGISAARTHLLQADNRVFLEVERFDRTGRFGRLPMVSLRAVDNEFYGHQDSWVLAARRMEGDGRLPAGDAANLRWLSVFGDLIANTDQHFGNVSLVPVETGGFRLAPAYDMLPMLYRPLDGVLLTRTFTPPGFASGAPEAYASALARALLFWERTVEEPRISEEFRGFCRSNLEKLKALASGPRLVV